MNRVLLSAILLLVASCSSSNKSNVQPQQDGAEVSIAVSSDVASRTAIDPDGTTVRWSVGDKVALWATGETSNREILKGDMFTLKYYTSTFDVAEFSASSSSLADFASMSSDETYTYKAVYPHTKSINGSKVTWTLPATQSGNYDGSSDLRVAEAVSGVAALSKDAAVECDLKFKSLLHQLRVTIPAGYNGLDIFGSEVRITGLTVTMPFECVGDVTVDIDDLEAQTVVENGSTTVTIPLSKSIQAGDGTELILFILPKGDVSGDILISATGSNGSASVPTAITIDNKSFTKGKYSTVGATIGAPVMTTLDFNSIDYSQLGEPVKKITVTAPVGVVFTKSGTNSATLDLSSGTELSYLTSDAADSPDSKLIASGLSVVYESDNAIVSGTYKSFSAATFKPKESNSVKLTAPYLFFEDFSGLNADFHNTDSYAVGGMDSVTNDDGDTTLGTANGLNNDGWTGQRVGGSKGNSIRVCTRVEVAVNVLNNYNGRLDSPQLSALKNSNVPIKVTYNYKGAVEMERTLGGANLTLAGYIQDGYNNTSNNSLIAVSGPNEVSFTGTCNSKATLTSFSNKSSYSAGNTGYDNVPTGASNTKTMTLNASSSTRLSWQVTQSCSVNKPKWYSTFSGNGNNWFYIDNIKVSINK